MIHSIFLKHFKPGYWSSSWSHRCLGPDAASHGPPQGCEAVHGPPRPATK